VEHIRLTQYSHGAGCGCKISPQVLEQMLAHVNTVNEPDPRLIVGNNTRDDAAVWDLGNGQGLVSTTDFFMPIVDDPHQFGYIAAANAISDVYAMGGKPVLAIAILGWPVDKLPPAVAGQVLAGGKAACRAAGIALAGGHSIDCPEPIFGLAVSGLVQLDQLKTNAGAQAGDVLFLTKPLGAGILTTAEKKGILKPEHTGLAAQNMMKLNSIGIALATVAGVTALTDVTGFGLLGHLLEMCTAANVQATLQLNTLPFLLPLPEMQGYIAQNSVPGGTNRNWASYGHRVQPLSAETIALLADPQTSGGLLIAVRPEAVAHVQALFEHAGLGAHLQPIGQVAAADPETAQVRVL
jgi:selenide, water dikinase